MGNITIKIIPNSSNLRRIDVDQNPMGKGGNLPVDPNASITWKADKSGEYFRVFFFDPDSPDIAFWPFEDGQQGHPPDGYAGPKDDENPFLLVVKQAKPRKLKSTALTSIKFDVVAVTVAGVALVDVERLDPVIIIRPARWLNVAFGVTCAVLGAIVGAATAISIMS